MPAPLLTLPDFSDVIYGDVAGQFREIVILRSVEPHIGSCTIHLSDIVFVAVIVMTIILTGTDSG